MKGDKSTQYNLSPENEAKMKELLEEVRGRLEEMSSIFCQAVGIEDRSNVITKFDPKIVSGHPSHIEIICDATSCGCIVEFDDGHVLVEWPCGTGG